MSSLKARTVSGATWAGLGQMATQALGFLGTLVLARLLAPEDFGLLGMAVVFTGFLAIFQSLGLGSAIVQDRTLTGQQLSGLFWVNLLVTLLLAAIAVALAPLVAGFYGRPEVMGVIVVLAAAFPLAAVGMVPQALLTRDMDFRRLSMIDLVSQAVGLALGIALAAMGMGVWALVGQQVMAAAVTASLRWFSVPWRPGLALGLRRLTRPLGFGAQLQAGSVLGWGSRNIDDLLIGRFVGAAPLGIYQMAYRLMLWPIQSVSRVVGQVMFPALSAMEGDTGRVRRGFMRGTEVVALITFPAMIGAGVVAEAAIPLVLGPGWTAVVPVFEILCGLGLVQSVATNTGWIFLSQGRADVRLKLQLFMTPVLILSFVVGLRWGVVGVAGAYAVTSAVLIPIQLHVAGRLVGLRLGDIARPLARILGLALLMGLIVVGVGWATADLLPSWASLALQVSSGIAAYGWLVHRGRIPAYLELRRLLSGADPPERPSPVVR